MNKLLFLTLFTSFVLNYGMDLKESSVSNNDLTNYFNAVDFDKYDGLYEFDVCKYMDDLILSVKHLNLNNDEVFKKLKEYLINHESLKKMSFEISKYEKYLESQIELLLFTL